MTRWWCHKEIKAAKEWDMWWSQMGDTDQALMPSWTGAAWNVEPRELERVSWWWDSQSDGVVDPGGGGNSEPR